MYKPKTYSKRYQDKLLEHRHMFVRWDNGLVDSSADMGVLEKRLCYFISGWVNARYKKDDLENEDRWKDLQIEMSSADLGLLCTNKNKQRTWDSLKSLAGKIVQTKRKDDDGNFIIGYTHWVSDFREGPAKGKYTVVISPELKDYLINIRKRYTLIDVAAAMNFQSKATQRMYEICCQYSGNYSYKDPKTGERYKVRVHPVSVKDLRRLFHLDYEVKDTETNETVKESIYENFNAFENNILRMAQDELYFSYMNGATDVWFDYQLGPRVGKGGKIQKVLLNIYTRKHPKGGTNAPWVDGDPELCPFQEVRDKEIEEVEKDLAVAEKDNTPDVEDPRYMSKTKRMEFYKNVTAGPLKKLLRQNLSFYLPDEEVEYYMQQTNCEALLRSNKADAYAEMIEVIKEKQGQPSFEGYTPKQKRYALTHWVFIKNLKKNAGWSIPLKGQKLHKNKK